MALIFPNPSRSFDASRKRVQFWAYDRSMEVSFSVGIEALQKLVPELNGTEAQILKLFDDIREQIHVVASRIYARGRPGTYAFDLEHFHVER